MASSHIGAAASSGSSELSRRAIVGVGGGGLAMLLFRLGVPAAAQEGSPVAGAPDMGRAYLAIREYQLAPGRTMEELTTAVASGFAPILRDVPGFQEYSLVQTSEGVISISVFTDQSGAEESTRRAADWVKLNIADMFSGPPTVTTGSVWLHEAGGAADATPAP